MNSMLLITNDDLIRVAASVNARKRRLGANARCACGEKNPLLLRIGAAPVRCLECQARNTGRPTSEMHHLGGRPSTLTISVPVNVHAVATALQWPLWRHRYRAGSIAAVVVDLAVLQMLLSIVAGDEAA
jgi:hypothetical protein